MNIAYLVVCYNFATARLQHNISCYSCTDFDVGEFQNIFYPINFLQWYFNLVQKLQLILHVEKQKQITKAVFFLLLELPIAESFII